MGDFEMIKNRNHRKFYEYTFVFIFGFKRIHTKQMIKTWCWRKLCKKWTNDDDMVNGDASGCWNNNNNHKGNRRRHDNNGNAKILCFDGSFHDGFLIN